MARSNANHLLFLWILFCVAMLIYAAYTGWGGEGFGWGIVCAQCVCYGTSAFKDWMRRARGYK